jgi:hypothetical protein
MSFIKTSNNLKSATTLVDVSASTAPTTGQVLTATSDTTATWQDAPSGGGGVPYTGATADVDLQTHSLVLTSGGVVYNTGGADGVAIKGGTDGVVTITPEINTNTASLDFNSMTADKTYTFPDTTGTVALTSDLIIKKATVTIPSASVSTLNTVPYILLAGITGKVINVLSVIVDTTAFSGYTPDVLYVSTESNPQTENYFGSSPMALTNGICVLQYKPSAYETFLSSGDGVVICAGNDPGAGTGDMIVYVTYEEITL